MRIVFLADSWMFLLMHGSMQPMTPIEHLRCWSCIIKPQNRVPKLLMHHGVMAKTPRTPFCPCECPTSKNAKGCPLGRLKHIGCSTSFRGIPTNIYQIACPHGLWWVVWLYGIEGLYYTWVLDRWCLRQCWSWNWAGCWQKVCNLKPGHGSREMQLWTNLKAMAMLWASDESLATLPHWRHLRMLLKSNLNYPSESSSMKNHRWHRGSHRRSVNTTKCKGQTQQKWWCLGKILCLQWISESRCLVCQKKDNLNAEMSGQWMSKKSHGKAARGPIRVRGAIAKLLMPLHWNRPGCGQLPSTAPKKNLVQTCEIEAGSMKPNWVWNHVSERIKPSIDNQRKSLNKLVRKISKQ